MEKALPLVARELQKAEAHHVKIVLGTDAVAGSRGRNAEEFIYRVQEGGQDPMRALLSGTSLAAESLGLADQTPLHRLPTCRQILSRCREIRLRTLPRFDGSSS